MEITVINRQRKIPCDTAWLRRAARLALDKCAAFSGDGRFAVRALPGICIAIVSDAAIARVHRDFMGIPGATDVITFDHGEIVISAETAARCAREHGHATREELALYIIHGLLHLNGHDDTTAAARRAMFRVQERVWREVRATA